MNSFIDLWKKLFGTGKAAAGSEKPSLPVSTIEEQRPTWLVIGLGNPGAKYAATRHNVGYMVVDDLLAENGDLLEPIPGFKAAGAVISLASKTGNPTASHKVLVLRSTTFMNLSGEAVAPLAQAAGIPAENIIVVHDELDLPENKIRLKKGGNENGHNGLKSITEHLGTREYLRVRVGISRPPKGTPIPDYVLGPVSSGAELDTAISSAVEAVRAIVTRGLTQAQNQIHSR